MKLNATVGIIIKNLLVEFPGTALGNLELSQAVNNAAGLASRLHDLCRARTFSKANAADGIQQIIAGITLPCSIGINQAQLDRIVSDLTKPQRIGDRRQLKDRAPGTIKNAIQDFGNISLILTVMAQLDPRCPAILEVLASLKGCQAPPVEAVRTIEAKLERAMTSVVASGGLRARSQRGLRTALARLTGVEYSLVEDAKRAAGVQPKHRLPYAKRSALLAGSAKVAKIDLSALAVCDLRGLHPLQIAADLEVICHEAGLPGHAFKTSPIELYHRHLARHWRPLNNLSNAIVEGWVEGQSEVTLPGAVRSAGMDARLTFTESEDRMVVALGAGPLPKVVLAAISLKLLLQGVNLESLRSGRFFFRKSRLIFVGRKPRARHRSVAMEIQDPVIEKFVTQLRKRSVRLKDWEYQQDGVRRKLTEKDFRCWFKQYAVPCLPDVDHYCVTSIRPLVASLLSEQCVGELASVKRHLHHESIRETVGYADSVARRWQLDTVAVDLVAEMEALSLCGAPPVVWDALNADHDHARATAAEFLRQHDPDRKLAAGEPLFACLEPPTPAWDHRKPSHQMPHAPVAATAALWRASAISLATAMSVLNSFDTLPKFIKLEVDTAGGVRKVVTFSRDEFIEHVHTAARVAFHISGVAREGSRLASCQILNFDGHQRLAWDAEGGQYCRLSTATAALAVRVVGLLRKTGASKEADAILADRLKPNAIGKLCKFHSIASEWAPTLTHNRPPALFSPYRLEDAMAVMVKGVRGPAADHQSVLAYLCADHDDALTERRSNAADRAIRADIDFSIQCNIQRRRSLTMTVAPGAPPAEASLPLIALNDNELSRPTEQSAGHETLHDQLAMRQTILERLIAAGIVPGRRWSFASVRRWDSPEHGVRPLDTKALTPGHPTHGPLVKQLHATLKQLNSRHSADARQVPLGELFQAAKVPCRVYSHSADDDEHEAFCAFSSQSSDFRRDLGALIMSNRNLVPETARHRAGHGTSFVAFCIKRRQNILGSDGFEMTGTDAHDLVSRWRDELLIKGLKATSVNKTLQGARYALEAMKSAVPTSHLYVAARLADMLIESTKTLIDRSVRSARRRMVGDAEITALISAAARTQNPQRDVALIELARASALRASEVARVAANDVSGRQGDIQTFQLLQKGGSFRDVSVARDQLTNVVAYAEGERAELLKKLGKNTTEAAPSELFLSNRGRPMTGKALAQIVSTIAAAAGLTDLNIHHLRKRGINELKDCLEGAGHDVAKHLHPTAGHASPKTTNTYYVDGQRSPASIMPSSISNDFEALAGRILREAA